jgi:hypothetical protein
MLSPDMARFSGDRGGAELQNASGRRRESDMQMKGSEDGVLLRKQADGLLVDRPVQHCTHPEGSPVARWCWGVGRMLHCCGATQWTGCHCGNEIPC